MFIFKHWEWSCIVGKCQVFQKNIWLLDVVYVHSWCLLASIVLSENRIRNIQLSSSSIYLELTRNSKFMNDLEIISFGQVGFCEIGNQFRILVDAIEIFCPLHPIYTDSWPDSNVQTIIELESTWIHQHVQIPRFRNEIISTRPLLISFNENSISFKICHIPGKCVVLEKEKSCEIIDSVSSLFIRLCLIVFHVDW